MPTNAVPPAPEIIHVRDPKTGESRMADLATAESWMDSKSPARLDGPPRLPDEALYRLRNGIWLLRDFSWLRGGLAVSGVSETVQQLSEDEALTWLRRYGFDPPTSVVPLLNDENPAPRRVVYQADVSPNNPPHPTSLADDPTTGALLSAGDLADRLRLPKNAVEVFLRRYRASHLDCAVKVDNPKRNEAQYLYRAEQVVGVLKTHFHLE
jgi:hypothetical protein